MFFGWQNSCGPKIWHIFSLRHPAYPSLSQIKRVFRTNWLVAVDKLTNPNIRWWPRGGHVFQSWPPELCHPPIWAAIDINTGTTKISMKPPEFLPSSKVCRDQGVLLLKVVTYIFVYICIYIYISSDLRFQRSYICKVKSKKVKY